MFNAAEYIVSNHISIQESDFVKSIFKNEYSAISKNKQSLVVYGAGSAGQEIAECLSLHGLEVEFFCDKNPSLIGSKIMGKEVISPDHLISAHKEKFVVVGTQRYKNEIYEYLLVNGVTSVGFISDDQQYYYYLQFPRWKNSLENIKKDQAFIDKAFSLLADKKSQDIYLKRLKVLSSYADYNAYLDYCQLSDYPADLCIEDRIFSTNFESEMYFNNDLINLEENASMIDAGAFDGDSFIQFNENLKKKNFHYSSVYCFEPDNKNFKTLKSNLSDYQNIVYFNKGLWNKKETLKFASSELMYEVTAHPKAIAESRIIQHVDELVINSNKGDIHVQVDTIDNLIYPNKVDIIKMDVEGSEENAILGGIKTIQRYKPQLIISAYHKKDDIYKLILLINQICPDYRIYIRQFSFSWSEAVIIAKI